MHTAGLLLAAVLLGYIIYRHVPRQVMHLRCCDNSQLWFASESTTVTFLALEKQNEVAVTADVPATDFEDESGAGE